VLEISGDIWEPHVRGYWIVITTNGIVRKDGACVMGRGVARDAALRYPTLPFDLGHLLTKHGNHVFHLKRYKIITFPVKHHWREPADLDLIRQSAVELLTDSVTLAPPEIYLVRPGCGNGQLDWEDVRPVLAPILDDRFIVVHP
jgi:hypothetical protein